MSTPQARNLVISTEGGNNSMVVQAYYITPHFAIHWADDEWVLTHVATGIRITPDQYGEGWTWERAWVLGELLSTVRGVQEGRLGDKDSIPPPAYTLMKDIKLAYDELNKSYSFKGMF